MAKSLKRVFIIFFELFYFHFQSNPNFKHILMSFRVCVFKSLSFEVNCYSRGNHRVWASRSGVMLNTSISPQVPVEEQSRSQFVQLLLRFFFCVDPDSCEFACNRILTRGQTNQTNLKTVICNADDLLFPTQTDFFCTGRQQRQVKYFFT